MDAQGSQTNAKADTVFLALSSNLTTDLSQRGTNLTAATGGGYETNSARASLSEHFEVCIRCVLTKNENDLIFIAHHDAALTTSTFSLGTNNSGEFQASMNGAVVWVGPSVPAGDCSFSWSMRPNPDTTGARISEFIVYDHTAGDYLAIEQVTHAVPTTAGTYTLSVGGVWDGASLLLKPATAPSKARVSSSHHGNVEFAEDWVAARAGHTHTLDRLIEPIGAGLAAGGQGAWAGQANVGFCAAHANALRGRMLSPMVNEVYADARTLTTTPDPTQWIIAAPSSANYLADCTKLRWLSCDGWRYAQVRAQVQTWVTSGSAVPFGLRCYAMNRPHIGLGVQLGGKPIPPLIVEYGEATLTEDHTSSGEGEWLDLGVIRLPMMTEQIEGWLGTVTLVLAYAFDPASASSNDANARAKIKAWQVLPIVGEP